MKIYAVDLDGTLANKGRPIKKNVKKVNRLYERKNTMVIIHTSRNETLRKRTINYLKLLGVKYHLLVMDKLRADVYVDDRSVKW